MARGGGRAGPEGSETSSTVGVSCVVCISQSLSVASTSGEGLSRWADGALCSGGLPPPLYIFPFFWAELLGGVTGLPACKPPYGNFFLSAGFRIWNEHISVSSTLIMAPALSNSPQ